MKNKILFFSAALLAGCFAAFGQTQFFKSTIDFSDVQGEFYSSVAVDESTVVFVANNHTIHAFDKAGTEKWTFDSNWKTNKAPYIFGDTIVTGYYANSDTGTRAAFVNKKDGTLIKALPFEPVSTKPYFKNGIMYCTAIYNAGQILAYDIKNDTVLWDRFVAHGVSNQPVYLKDKIIANAEEQNWFELDYNNKLLGTCDNPAGFVNDITCVKNYMFLSHDGKEISEKLLNTYFNDAWSVEKYFTKDNTFIMDSELLLILGKKVKVKQKINLNDISIEAAETDDYESTEIVYSNYFDILKADEKNLWFISNNVVIQYDLKAEKAVKTYNVTQWNPHRAVLDGNKLWLINGTDFQLYGLELN